MHRRNALVLMSAAALGAAVPALGDEPEIRVLAAGATSSVRCRAGTSRLAAANGFEPVTSSNAMIPSE